MSAFGGSNASRRSTTVSEFVRRRYNGEVPVLGGDVRVGVSEAVSALRGSAQQHVLSALASATQALTIMQRTMNEPDESEEPVTSPARLQDIAYTQEQLNEAVTLTDDQIRLLLDASAVSTNDANMYKELICGVKDAVIKKRRASELSLVRRTPASIDDLYVDDQEILGHVARYKAGIRALAIKWGIHDDYGYSLMYRAFVHHSVVAGRSTNDTLAMIGNVALNVMIKSKLATKQIDVDTMNELSYRVNSTSVLCRVAMDNRLDLYVCVDDKTDVRSRTVLATTVEAIYGALYEYGGIALVSEGNELHLKLCELN